MAGSDPTGIGQLNEGPLHAALKAHLARPGDCFEQPLGRYVIDIVRADLLIEIQTAGFSNIKTKLHHLAANQRVRLVYPIAAQKWIVRLPRPGESKILRRKSPKRGVWIDLFSELVSFPKLIAHPNFSLEVILIEAEEVRRFAGQPHWRRRGWVTQERRLVRVAEQKIFNAPQDFLPFLPQSLPSSFTTADLAASLACSRRLAQQMAYCLAAMGQIAKTGTQNRFNLYVKTDV